MDSRLGGSFSFTCHPATVADWCDVGRVTIDKLPDVALLEIFDFYLNEAFENGFENMCWPSTEAWHTLVHVCRKWRATVFGSPLRLDLRLLCKDTTPVEEKLAVWPPLPIVIEQIKPRQMDHIIAALGHNDRVCEIDLALNLNRRLGKVLDSIKQPFPALRHLEMWLLDRHWNGYEWEDEDEGEDDHTPPVVSESFLGGSAPRLQHLLLRNITFPGLPKLLLSATGLVSLCLDKIPDSGYISPEAMARCLSTLTRLDELWLKFESPQPRPVQESRRPPSILPALTDFEFQGVSEYLEDLVARIDAPLLDSFRIMFLHQVIFDTPQLAQFLARTPNIQPPAKARIIFSHHDVEVTCPSTYSRSLSSGISCSFSALQLSSLAQVCSSSFPEAFILTVEHLYICEYSRALWSGWQDDFRDSQWLEVLRPFTAVKYLYLSLEFTLCIAPALPGLVGEVLPSLQNLFLEDLYPSGSVQGAIENLVAARKLTGHPIAVFHCDRKQDEW
jgi:hypothetical protein